MHVALLILLWAQIGVVPALPSQELPEGFLHKASKPELKLRKASSPPWGPKGPKAPRCIPQLFFCSSSKPYYLVMQNTKKTISFAWFRCAPSQPPLPCSYLCCLLLHLSWFLVSFIFQWREQICEQYLSSRWIIDLLNDKLIASVV